MNISYRNEVVPEDVRTVEYILRSTNFFRDDEITVACELVKERLTGGPASGYEFLLAETEGKTIAFTCFGLIPCTLISFDLYWIATLQEYRNQGIGKKLLAMTEDIIRTSGGHAIYVETSSKPAYESTRAFYFRNGYERATELKDYYDFGDNKLIFVKNFH